MGFLKNECRGTKMYIVITAPNQKILTTHQTAE